MSGVPDGFDASIVDATLNIVWRPFLKQPEPISSFSSLIAVAILGVSVLAVGPVGAAEAEAPAAGADEARVVQARAAVKALMGGLKTQLKAALKEGGPVKALSVCKQVAPKISADVSSSSAFEVGRTSLKVRNPANAPDDFERAALETFAAQLKDGANPKTLETSAVVATGDGKVFRYLKAIPMSAKPCAACHGSEIKSEVKAAIDELYPEDQAVGFKPGELRGAFTLTQAVK